MAQYRPSELIPSTLSSEYSVDPTKVNTFTCQINGTSPTTKYRLKIMKNNQQSTMVYDTGVVKLTTPLYPVDSNGNVNLLSVSIPANKLTSGTEYKWTITSYWGTSTTTDYFESYENVFYAYSVPVVTIKTIPATMDYKSYTFSGSATTVAGVSIERFGWLLMNKDTGEVLVDTITSNNIYSSQMQLYYDGFFTNNTYTIKLKCWFSNGVSAESDTEEFSVEYETVDASGFVNGYNTCDGGMLVEWPDVNYIPSSVTGSVSLVENDFVNGTVADIEKGASIVFNQSNGETLQIPSSSTIVISFYAKDSGPPYSTPFGEELFKMTTQFVNEAGNNVTASFTLNIGYGKISLSAAVKENNAGPTYIQDLYNVRYDDSWYVVKFNMNEASIITNEYDNNGLFPSETLYLSNSLLPDDGTFSPYQRKIQVLGFPTQTLSGRYFDTVTLNGKQLINYLWISTNDISDEQFLQFGDYSIEPEWTPGTKLLALFNSNFEGGNIKSDVLLSGWLVYRQDQFSSHLTFVDKVENTKQWTVDYAVSNQNIYTYVVFPVSEEKIGIPLISGLVTTDWWSWYLLICNDGENGSTYFVDDVFEFDLDVSTTAMSNNTAFNTLQNFTQYPKIQRSNSNYWSGSISALLGNCNVKYEDTIKRMNELKALSTDTRTKFLKDRKGNLWRVEITNPIGEQMNDVFAEQQVTVTLNWAEVGPVDGVKIVQNPALPKSLVRVCDKNYLNGG